MSSGLSPFHFSFEHARNIDEGTLLLSEAYPKAAIRNTTQVNPLETMMRTAKSCEEQIQSLESLGLKTVSPKPVITENGIAYVCDRLQGNSLDQEIAQGNASAASEYGNTLLSLANYYISNFDEPCSDIFGDIAAPNQFTWEKKEVVLHDISTVVFSEHKPTIVLQNSCQIAYEALRHSESFDTEISQKIFIRVGELIDRLQSEPGSDIKSILFLRLTVALAEERNYRAMRILADAYIADLFEV